MYSGSLGLCNLLLLIFLPLFNDLSLKRICSSPYLEDPVFAFHLQSDLADDTGPSPSNVRRGRRAAVIDTKVRTK